MSAILTFSNSRHLVEFRSDLFSTEHFGGGGVANAIFLEPKPSGETFADESDRVFYEVALAGRDDDARLVTGNLRHYPISPIVVTPAQMIAIIEERFAQ